MIAHQNRPLRLREDHVCRVLPLCGLREDGIGHVIRPLGRKKLVREVRRNCRVVRGSTPLRVRGGLCGHQCWRTFLGDSCSLDGWEQAARLIPLLASGAACGIAVVRALKVSRAEYEVGQEKEWGEGLTLLWLFRQASQAALALSEATFIIVELDARGESRPQA